ncbi:MAG: hypothetical protein N4P89_00515 [Candidatus Lightella neohaematopini]|nr:hypothetical protein [Candidatus Lightella neohaematopini]
MYLLFSIFINLILINHLYSAPILLDKINTIVNNSLILDSDINNEFKYIFKSNKYIYNNYDYYIMCYRIIYMLIIDNITLSKDIINNKQIENIIKRIINDENINSIDFFTLKIRFNFIKNKIYQIILNKQISNYIIQNVIISEQEINILSKQIINRYLYKIKIKSSYFVINLLNYKLNNKLEVMKVINNSINYSNNCLYLNKLKYLVDKKLISIKNYNNGWQSINDLPLLIKRHIKKIYKNILIGPICTKNKIYFLKVNDIYKLNKIITNNRICIIKYIIINPKYFINQLLLCNFNNIKKQILKKTIDFNSIINKLSFGNINFYNTGIWFSYISHMHPIIKKIILNMHTNDISNPIKIGNNWYIIQLLNNYYNKDNFYLKKYSYLIILKRYFSEVVKILIDKKYYQSYINSNVGSYK